MNKSPASFHKVTLLALIFIQSVVARQVIWCDFEKKSSVFHYDSKHYYMDYEEH